MSKYSSRADYFRSRRQKIVQFGVNVPREKKDALNAKLQSQGTTMTRWLNEKIDEELAK